MRGRRISFAACCAVICASAHAESQQSTVLSTSSRVVAAAEGPPTPKAVLREAEIEDVKEILVQRLNAQDGNGLFSMLSPQMQQVLPLEKATPWVQGIIAAKGRIESATLTSGTNRRGTYQLKTERGEWRMELAIDKTGQILGLQLSEGSPEPAVARSDIPLALPFRGEWFVFWGGDKIEVNPHVNHKSQRRAADLVVVDENGKSFRTDGKKNEDYFAYGKKVLAVADGTAITVIDGVPENVPGSKNPYLVPGNMVIIRHTPTLYSAYAHLQPGKIRTKVGAKVRQGDVVGLCGNSGNSSEPHLHFQLQDGPLFESGWGVEPVFSNVAVIGRGKAERASNYSFFKGDRVQSSSADRR